MHEDNRRYTHFATVHETHLGVDTLHVFGDVDASVAPALEAAIADAEPASGALVIDCTECRYFDSSGIAVVVRARKRLGSRLALRVRHGTAVARVLEITRLHLVIPIAVERVPRPVAALSRSRAGRRRAVPFAR